MLVVASFAAAVWLAFVDDVGPSDFLVYRRAAAAVARGASPYVSASDPFLWSGHAFVYPYATAWWFVPLAGLSIPSASLIFYLLNVCGLVGAAFLLIGRRPTPTNIALCLAAEPVVRALQLGTLNAVMLFGLAVAWRFRHRSSVVALALGAVIGAKLFLVPMLAWLVLTRRYRAAAFAGVAALLMVIGGFAAGSSPLRLATMLSALSAHEAAHSSSLIGALVEHGFGAAVATGVGICLAGAVVGAGVMLGRDLGREAYLFCACIVAALVTTPIVWSHYYTLLLVVPFTLGAGRAVQGLLLVGSWMIGVPDRGAALAVLHPFPGAGWLWCALIITVALAWHRRCCGPLGETVRARRVAVGQAPRTDPPVPGPRR